jgi:hypothetical protein
VMSRGVAGTSTPRPGASKLIEIKAQARRTRQG